MSALQPLLRLYPRRWRQRYQEEMSLTIAAERPTLRLAVDLIAGAIDARLNPQLMPRLESAHHSGGMTMGKLLHCRPDTLSTAEYLRSAGVMLGATLGLTAVFMVLRMRIGESPFVDALGAATFPIALILSMRSTYMKRYSSLAAWTMIAGLIAIVFAITLAVEILADRI